MSNKTTGESPVAYCSECGSALRTTSKEAVFDDRTGVLIGYLLKKKCTGRFFKCAQRRLGARWTDYEVASNE